MTIAHHLDDATVLRYAAGDLDEAFAIVVSSHVAMCDQCRKAVRDAETAGGLLMEDVSPAPLGEGAFERMMERIETVGEEGSIRAKAKPPAPAQPGLPAPLARYIGCSLEDVKWRTVAPGVRKCDISLPTKTGSSLFLLQINSGMSIPEHGHGGDEMTLVLKGAYRDEFGRFGAGDIADLDEHIEHQPHVEPDGPCTCLVAAQTPTRFRGLLMRLLQPVFGI